jgi:hypothetical protein
MGLKIFSTLDKFPHYTIEFVHIEQISALFKRLIQVSLYLHAVEGLRITDGTKC